MPRPFELIGTITSKSSGDTYEIRRDDRGVIYCHNRSENKLCKAWQFNRDVPKHCKHIDAYNADVAAYPVANVVAAKKVPLSTMPALPDNLSAQLAAALNQPKPKPKAAPALTDRLVAAAAQYPALAPLLHEAVSALRGVPTAAKPAPPVATGPVQIRLGSVRAIYID